MTPQRYCPPHEFGIGGVAIGNEFQFATDEQAEATLAAAWDAGIRYFDVAPWYGLGLAERRFGRFLSRKPRDEFVISSEVGKLMRAGRENEAKTYVPFTTSPNNAAFRLQCERRAAFHRGQPPAHGARPARHHVRPRTLAGQQLPARGLGDTLARHRKKRFPCAYSHARGGPDRRLGHGRERPPSRSCAASRSPTAMFTPRQPIFADRPC